MDRNIIMNEQLKEDYQRVQDYLTKGEGLFDWDSWEECPPGPKDFSILYFEESEEKVSDMGGPYLAHSLDDVIEGTTSLNHVYWMSKKERERLNTLREYCKLSLE